MLPVQRVHCCPPHGKGCSGSHSRCRYQRRPDESRQGVVAEQGCSPLPPSRPRCFTTPWPLPMDAPRPPLTPKNSTAPSLPAGPGTSTEADGAAAVPLQTPAPCRAGPAAGTQGPRTDPSPPFTWAPRNLPPPDFQPWGTQPKTQTFSAAHPRGLRPPLCSPLRVGPVTLPSRCRGPSPLPAHSSSAPGHCTGTAGLCRAQLVGTGRNGVPQGKEPPHSAVGTTGSREDGPALLSGRLSQGAGAAPRAGAGASLLSSAAPPLR